jgi:hypothetical protein
MQELTAIGDLVYDGTYRVHSRFRRAVNFTDGSHLVTVVGSDMDAGPININVCGFDAATARTLRVERGAVTLDGTRLPFDDRFVYLSEVRPLHPDRGTFLAGVTQLGTLLVREAPEKSLAFLMDGSRMSKLNDGFELNLGRHISSCVRDILFWDRLRGVRRLKGCGFGLTPSGDDFIAGFLLGLNVLGRLGLNDWSETRRDVLQTALSGNMLTDTFLFLAQEGRVFESMKLLIAALAKGWSGDIRASTERLLSVGATSGADMAVGLQLTVREGLARRLRRFPRRDTRRETICDPDALWS